MLTKAKVAAYDGDSTVTFHITMETNKTISPDEREKMIRRAVQGAADCAKDTPYSDFGAYNTTVKL